MDWTQLLNDIFRLCIVPLMGVLTSYIVNYLRKKSLETQTLLDNEQQKKYVQLLTNIVVTCVTTTNQTYVDSLKSDNIFDKAAQKEAFETTFNAVKGLLTQEAINSLEIIYTDLDEYIRCLIEDQVYVLKRDKEKINNEI